MCGFIGFWQRNPASAERLIGQVSGMARALVHRGPDDAGSWADPARGVAFGFRRLAILDLSADGHQPMVSPDGRWVLMFNGEVYNFPELRSELESLGQSFRGGSDTEVVLAAVAQWGLSATLPRLAGMFAIAVWDRERSELALARDPLGIKPLYYGWSQGRLYFGSELKAFCAHREFSATLDRDALAACLRLGCIPAPYTIYQGVFKLPPGCSIQFPSPDDSSARPQPYWSLRTVAEVGSRQRFSGSEAEAADLLDKMLRRTVREQMVADVPLGAFLSGGIDSSLVVALMQAQSSRPVRTFSVGFEEADFDEAPQARAVARHLGTDHTEMYVTPREAMAVIPSLPRWYDEPFADSSQIPTAIVSQLTRRHVTVALSGDGGDEVFGGYVQHWTAPEVWRRMDRYPLALRRWAARTMRATATRLAPLRSTLAQRGCRSLGRRAELLVTRTPEECYGRMRGQWSQPDGLVLGGREPATAFTDAAQWARVESFSEHIMYVDAICGLPDDMLVKVDRASMAASLEVRVPLLDHRLVDFAWRLPLSLKVRANSGKWILRQVLDRYVPRRLVDRPKQGFGVPIGTWLRGPLREWAEELLDESRLRAGAHFDVRRVRAEWRALQVSAAPWEARIWPVLMFQAWHEHWREQSQEVRVAA